MKRIRPDIATLSFFLAAPVLLFGGRAAAQQMPQPDSGMLSLPAVVVSAFGRDRKLSDQPAPLAYISGTALSRYPATGILSALNAVPGVRMEQRSPASYRLNIRGSSLRSPFGVRNVKIYYDGMPLTEPGGNTYLNQLGYGDIASVEIIKGPAGSLYGAGTGGVVLITGPLAADTGAGRRLSAGFGAGSSGLRKADAAFRWGGSHAASELRYEDLRATGYRRHSEMHRQTACWENIFHDQDGGALHAFFHYTDLYYQTPGGLNGDQFKKDPRSARPASGPYPSAAENKASVYQKDFFAGFSRSYPLSSRLKNTTVVYGAYTDFTNPAILNYEYRKEPHFGGRTVFEYHDRGARIHTRLWLGGEFQEGFFSVKDMQNKAGAPDTLMTDDHIGDVTAMGFAQGEWTFPGGWDATAAVSLNHERLRFTRLYPRPVAVFTRRYRLILSPRLALAKKITRDILGYLDVSRGFSPPSVAELLPSTAVLNTTLQAEQGLNYELGTKGYLLHHRLYYDVGAFVLRLTQSISERRDSSGADYFVNAGDGWQKGLEGSLTLAVYHSRAAFVKSLSCWLSADVMDFRYGDYSNASGHYSGLRMPGTPPFTAAAGLDMAAAHGLQAHLSWQHAAAIPLNDANSVEAAPYDLVGCRLSWTKPVTGGVSLLVSASGDNLLNETYSLGDDINAAAGRYYNVAAPANFYGSLQIKWSF
jgi:iron complex outermembrane receptor protein